MFLKAVGYLGYCRMNTGVKKKLAQQTKSQLMCDYAHKYINCLLKYVVQLIKILSVLKVT